ncbi:flagellin [Salicibibacter kimchii]|uniref:Flagellin n=1 Tax=Salicibibacter kimchii TaxID=2099786 RepID=A0A345C2A0_9BACI|nr:flagellin [Salicibibacter kimchii]AXF57331.1 flagellin [Salicibibacter kimchii]
MIINNNLSAMNAHRQLGVNQNNMENSMEKLSSGEQINRAGDDAAGLAISEKMRAQIRGLDQASNNAQDGISLIQTAEGALDESHQILQRMRELSVQSANDTNEQVDREALQNEFDALAEEIDRISNDTEFNNHNLLDGSFQDQKFQIGANEGQEISVSIGEMSAIELEVGQEATGTTTIDGLEITNESGESFDIAYQAATGENESTSASYDNGTITVTLGTDDSEDVDTTLGEIASEIGSVSELDIEASAVDNSGTTVSSIDDVEGGTVSASEVEGISIASNSDASSAIDTINEAINDVSTQRSELGAVQNRLEHTIANLDNASENLQAAESRIRDVDMAQEMMEFTQSNILSQASQSMLAQANQLPQNVLQLLQ